MKTARSIFGAFWLAWGAWWFLLMMIVCTPFVAITLPLFKRKAARWWIWFLFSKGAPFVLFMCGVRIKVFGLENIVTNQAYVFVANHTSQLDILTAASASKLPYKFLAKSEINKIPFFGYMTRQLAIMVDRSSKESREKSVQYMIEELNRNMSLLIYAEGTRNRTAEKLKEFKDGAFRVAVLAKKPLVAVTLVGNKTLNNPNGFQLFPGEVKVFWSKPIETTHLSFDDLPMLKERVKQEMLLHL